MYAFISGVIKRTFNNNIVIENNGMGYYIVVVDVNDYNVDENYTVYTHQYIKEDINVLYGFNSYEEKELFALLLTVNGIGPKMAFNVMAKKEIAKTYKAIKEKNVDYLMSFSGIGNKAANQIILKLQDKVHLDNKEVNHHNQKYNNVLEALIILGYNKKDIVKILEESDLSILESDLIKIILKKLNTLK